METVIPQKIQEKYQVVWRHHVGARYQVDILQLEDFEKTVDDVIGQLEKAGHSDLAAEHCPYFGQLWAAAEWLADEIAPLYLRHKKVLEIGCGLGVPSIVAARAGAQVTALDLHPDTGDFLATNCAKNQVSIDYHCQDWRQVELSDRFDLILASDVLYENHHAEEIIQFLQKYLARGAKAIVVDPCRWHYKEFEAELQREGFAVETAYCDGEERGHRIRLCTFTITWQQDHFPGCGALVKTSDGSYSLCHPEHGEIYHSHSGASTEARQLYIKASEIEQRFEKAEPVHVLDVGLGLGYNAMATLYSWFSSPHPCPLNLTSLEIKEELVEQLQKGPEWLMGMPEKWLHWCHQLNKKDPSVWQLQLTHPRSRAQANWQILVGNGLEIDLPQGIDYVWQDPFSPSKNPTMWSKDWFEVVGKSANSECRLVTYSVARSVRDALTQAGWNVAKIPTGTGKKAWLKAVKT